MQEFSNTTTCYKQIKHQNRSQDYSEPKQSTHESMFKIIKMQCVKCNNA